MPAWVHDRAQHLLAKNPSMDKGQAFAIATQQGHAVGKTPKSYGTKAGRREAKVKYDKPRKNYVKSPNPGKLMTPKLDDREKVAHEIMMRAFHEELFLIKNAGLMATLKKHVLGEVPQAMSSGQVRAHGANVQMARGKKPYERFGGAAVDPFVKSRMR